MKKQTISEIKQFQKIAGLLKETWHPDDPASVDVDDIEDKDPDDYDDISEDDSEAYSESGNTDAMGGINEEEDDEWANVPNTVEGWIDYLYSRANPKQKAKLANIYKHQMENEEAEDAYEFFTDLIDSSDPDAIIDLKDLNQYSGY